MISRIKEGGRTPGSRVGEGVEQRSLKRRGSNLCQEK